MKVFVTNISYVRADIISFRKYVQLLIILFISSGRFFSSIYTSELYFMSDLNCFTSILTIYTQQRVMANFDFNFMFSHTYTHICACAQEYALNIEIASLMKK
jgi:hypothetical protein